MGAICKHGGKERVSLQFGYALHTQPHIGCLSIRRHVLYTADLAYADVDWRAKTRPPASGAQVASHAAWRTNVEDLLAPRKEIVHYTQNSALPVHRQLIAHIFELRKQDDM